MRYDFLNPILDKLASEGRIKVVVGKHVDWISLKD